MRENRLQVEEQGEITVFLSLVFLCILSLMCGLIESARTAGASWYLKMAADSAMDSVFSNYHREVWEDYRLFLLEFGDPEEICDKWLEYMKPYEENHGWYPVVMESASVDSLTAVTDDNGRHLQQEIADYMKFGIWEGIGSDENSAGNLLESLKEAKSLGEISDVYSGHAKSAVKLEKALEEIGKSLDQQRAYRQAAAGKIGSWDGSGFRNEAKKLIKEIRRLPGLIKTYDKRADKLAADLEETHSKMETRKENLSAAVCASLESELKEYESYTAQEGTRRTEIDGLRQKTDAVIPVIEQAAERSEEVEEIIAEWDVDEMEEGPDEDGLWESVRVIWENVEIPSLSFTAGMKEPEKQDILEEIGKMVEFDLLSLVLPEGSQVSEGILPLKELPSATAAKREEAEGEDSLLDRLLTDEYCGRFLTCFCSDEEKEIRYEQEYLLGGESTEEENLKHAVLELVMLREGFNLIHILSNQQKREEARALAAAITGIVGAAPLTGILAFFIMTVWALGEALADTKALLAGEKTPVLKTERTWRLSLDKLLAFGEQGKLEGTGLSDSTGEGLDYGDYLKLLFLLVPLTTLLFRLMDVIQLNIRRKDSDFLMDHCAYEVKIKVRGTGKHVLFSGGDSRYPMAVETDKAY